MKNSEVKNKHKNKNGKLKNILSIWYFKRKIFPDGILMKHKARLCLHGGIQQWGVNNWEIYSPVINRIRVRSILAIASIHEFPSRSIECVLYFPQSDHDVDVFMDLALVMGVCGNRG